MDEKACIHCVYSTKIPRHSAFWCRRFPKLERVEYPFDHWCGEFKAYEETQTEPEYICKVNNLPCIKCNPGPCGSREAKKDE